MIELRVQTGFVNPSRAISTAVELMSVIMHDSLPDTDHFMSPTTITAAAAIIAAGNNTVIASQGRQKTLRDEADHLVNRNRRTVCIGQL